MIKACLSCVHRREAGNRQYCHRYPPQVVWSTNWENDIAYELPQSFWPRVLETDSCGEHAEKA